jgi:hypothetical protein
VPGELVERGAHRPKDFSRAWLGHSWRARDHLPWKAL